MRGSSDATPRRTRFRSRLLERLIADADDLHAFLQIEADVPEARPPAPPAPPAARAPRAAQDRDEMPRLVVDLDPGLSQVSRELAARHALHPRLAVDPVLPRTHATPPAR